jgi:predicted transposase/invertase (TIGR01784 family)
LGEKDWYHHYKIVNVKKPAREIKDLQMLFIELPKFQAKNFREKKLQVLWLRFLSELNEKTNQAPKEWLETPEIKEALDLAEEAVYTPEELASYDKYWDVISIEKTLLGNAEKQGEIQGEKKTKDAIAKKLRAKGFSLEEIAELTDLTQEEEVIQLGLSHSK